MDESWTSVFYFILFITHWRSTVRHRKLGSTWYIRFKHIFREFRAKNESTKSSEMLYRNLAIVDHKNSYRQDTLKIIKNRDKILVDADQHVTCGNQRGWCLQRVLTIYYRYRLSRMLLNIISRRSHWQQLWCDWGSLRVFPYQL